MAPQVSVNILLRLLLLTLSLFSVSSIAASDDIMALTEQRFDLSFVSLAISVLVVVSILIALQIKLSIARKRQLKQENQLSAHLTLTSDVKLGIVHLDKNNQIVFINNTAASYLGGSEQALLNQNFVSRFATTDHEHMSAALGSDQYASFQRYLVSSKRHLQISLAHPTRSQNAVTKVVSLVDVSNYQLKIDDSEHQLGYLNQSIENCQLAKLTLDLTNNSYSADPLFFALFDDLSTDQDAIDNITNRVIPAQKYDWQQALSHAKKEHKLDIRLELLRSATAISASQGSQPKEWLNEPTVTVRLIGLSSAKDKDGNTTKIGFMVQNLAQLKAQESLNKVNQAQIKTLLTASSNSIYVLDNEANLIDCNPAFERLFKQKLSKIQHKRLADLDFWPEELSQLQLSKSVGVNPLTLGKDKLINSQLNDGSQRTFKLTLQSLADGQNQPAGVIGVIQDLTELTQTKADLEQTRKHFTTILDLAPVAVTTIDADDKIITANIAMTDRLGLSERDLKKDNFYQLFNDPSNAAKAAKQIHQTGRLRQFNASLLGKSGELHPSELHMDLLNKDKQEYLCWISDRTGEQFQQDKFESLLQHSSMPMAVLAETGFISLNPAACQFFNIADESDLFGCTPYSLELNKDDIAATELERQVIKVKLDGQAKFFSWEHVVNGELLPCQVTFVPIYKGQEFDSILCIWMDYSELQEADKARAEALLLHEKAEQQVTEKQEQLVSSQAQLESKAQSLVVTESQLQAAKEDLTEKQQAFSHLQEAHESVAQDLKSLQQEYQHNRTMLADAQGENTELANQLEQSADKVAGLQRQRNQISDALQMSEKKYKTAQQHLEVSQQQAKGLKQQQQDQQGQMTEFVAEIDNLKQAINQKDQQINEVGNQITSLQSQLTSSGNTSEKLRQSLINQRKASELAEKQRRELEHSCKVAESELSNKMRHVDHLQNEMQKFEEMSTQQKGDMEKQQSQLMQELQEKQQQLQQTQDLLDSTKQTAEQEKQAKEQQQNLLQDLQQDLAEMENKSQQQNKKMADTEQQWKKQQLQVHEELSAKQKQLQQTEHNLALAQQQSESEKAQKEQQQAVFEKLTTELQEMEKRHQQQQQTMSDSDQKWQQQQQAIQQALKEKQQQLQETENSLSQTKQQTEQERKQQQALFETLQHELGEMEQRNTKQQQEMAEADEAWQLQQATIQQELKAKQQQLQQTESILIKAQQQAESEKTEKQKQQALLDKLQSELTEMEQSSTQQKQKIAQSDQDWKQQQQALQGEVDAKRQQLLQTQGKLDDIQRQAEQEKLARVEHQQKLEQLTVELGDVENRASKQKEMIEGSDEQWRKHHAEIEQQKQQLQQSLLDAEQHNQALQEKLSGNLKQLQDAEHQVSETQSAEQKLQQELNDARNQAEQLAQKLQQQEDQEIKLQRQLQQEQSKLQGSELSIHSLEAKQLELTQALENVQKEYSQSKESLNDKQLDHTQLIEQLKSLENNLATSQQQLDSKEQALQEAKQQLEDKESTLAAQENVLLEAHKEELQQAQQETKDIPVEASAIQQIAMPENPTIWFDLLPYLQNKTNEEPLPVALSALMNELESLIEATEEAVDNDDVTSILRSSRKLVFAAQKVNSEALTDLVTRLENDCQQGLVDNIAIAWPAVKRSLNNSLRVMYSHLHA